MKKLLFFFTLLILFQSCSNNGVKKPEKLLDEDQMVAIIYDISILEAMRSRDAGNENIPSREYIYKKYNIDSLEFVQNNTYYAADIKKYKKIYDKVSERVEREKKAADSILLKQGTKPAETPNKIGGITPDLPVVK